MSFKNNINYYKTVFQVLHLSNPRPKSYLLPQSHLLIKKFNLKRLFLLAKVALLIVIMAKRTETQI